MFTLEVLYAAGVCICIVICAYLWRMRTFYVASFRMRGPVAWPIVGNVFQFLGSMEDIVKSSEEMLAAYGSPLRLWLGNRFLVVIADPQNIGIVLNSPDCLLRDESYRFYREFLGESIFTATNVSRWRQQRKIVSPLFNTRMLNSFVPIFQQHSEVLCEKLEEYVDKGFFDVHSFICRCVLDIVGESILGVKINAQFCKSEYLHWLETITSICYKRMFNIWYQYDCIFKWCQDAKLLQETAQRARNFNENIIISKRKEYREKKASGQYADDDNKKVLLSYLIELSEEKRCLTDEDIRDEIATFTAAASDTSAGTTCFALMMLGMHPKVQAKVYQELQEIFGQNNRSITCEDLSKMKYLESVIKETLRIFPVSFVLGRSVTKEINLSNCKLPEGSTCILGVFQVHRNPKYWPDPLKFDPDRFLPEETAKRHPYAWIPFSAGPRNCIGLKYGMMVMKVVLATIVRKFVISYKHKNIEDIQLIPDLVLKPAEGHRISLEIRPTTV